MRLDRLLDFLVKRVEFAFHDAFDLVMPVFMAIRN